MANEYLVEGAGLGYRRSMLQEVQEMLKTPHVGINFMEIAPENWINLGGKLKEQFRTITEQIPFVAHGLSLSIGSPSPLDENLVWSIKQFMKDHGIRCYTEHLSYCSDHGHLYDLMPIPFTEEAVHYVANRIRRVQDILEQRIGMENVSYYTSPTEHGQGMTEIDFINAVIEESDCGLLLDVNNIYVNSINHGYDAETFLKALPGDRAMYIHTAGHYAEAEDLRVDTHGADVIDPVWKLLEQAYEHFGLIPTLLERDFNIPPLTELVQELDKIKAIQNEWIQSHERSDEKRIAF